MSTVNAIVQAAQQMRSTSEGATKGEVTPTSSSDVKYIDDSHEDIVTSSESTVDSPMTEESSPDESSPDQEAGAADPTAKSPVSGTKEIITVTDDKGKRKIEVDFSNKEQMKKFVQMAHGARKWQSERDQALTQIKDVETKYTNLKNTWDIIEKAYSENGIEGIVDVIEGRPGAFNEWEKSRIDRYEMLKKASPAERELITAKEQESRRLREIEQMKKENENFKKSIQAEREAAELRSLESTVHPAFDRYRFADKLGDGDTEQMFDQMLWDTSLKRLEQYEEQSVPITADLVEKEFKAVATALRKRINVQADKKAAKAVEQKKQEATEHVQAAVSSGYRNSNLQKEASDMIRNGNLTGLFKQWNKYGSVFGKK